MPAGAAGVPAVRLGPARPGRPLSRRRLHRPALLGDAGLRRSARAGGRARTRHHGLGGPGGVPVRVPAGWAALVEEGGGPVLAAAYERLAGRSAPRAQAPRLRADL